MKAIPNGAAFNLEADNGDRLLLASFIPMTHETFEMYVYLLAAAPDLLDALERMVHMAESNTVPGRNTLNQARAAIRAARGQEA